MQLYKQLKLSLLFLLIGSLKIYATPISLTYCYECHDPRKFVSLAGAHSLKYGDWEHFYDPNLQASDVIALDKYSLSFLSGVSACSWTVKASKRTWNAFNQHLQNKCQIGVAGCNGFYCPPALKRGDISNKRSTKP